LLCAERAKAASFNLLVCLVVNVGLNVPLIQHYGLTGSVVATLIANAVLLLLTFWTMSRAGCRTDARTLCFAFFPAILLLGIDVAASGLAILVVIAGRTNWILDHQDRKDIDKMVLPLLQKARIPLESLWPQVR
jgi:O-antigen/teichoic acid export membrane protein